MLPPLGRRVHPSIKRCSNWTTSNSLLSASKSDTNYNLFRTARAYLYGPRENTNILCFLQDCFSESKYPKSWYLELSEKDRT